jgi:proteasome lid subunit RPN8/RPN11
MAATENIWIGAECEEKMRAHGEETYPYECCGALLGRDAADEGLREVLDVFPLVNRRDDSPRNRFSLSPRDVIAAEREASVRGLDVVGWYHSHPDHPAKPSEYDREHAWPWYSYIILSVVQGTAAEMRSWRLREDRTAYDQEEIEVRKPEEAKK